MISGENTRKDGNSVIQSTAYMHSYTRYPVLKTVSYFVPFVFPVPVEEPVKGGGGVFDIATPI